MKTLMILCLLVAGCTGNKYEHTWTNDDGLVEKIVLQGYGANITKRTDGLAIILPDDAILILGRMYVWPDPNSAIAWGEAWRRATNPVDGLIER